MNCSGVLKLVKHGQSHPKASTNTAFGLALSTPLGNVMAVDNFNPQEAGIMLLFST